MKICFASSSGGHFEQLMRLKELSEKYESFIVTEKAKYSVSVGDEGIYFLEQINREDKDLILKLFKILYKSIKICMRERPDVVICTGVLATIPICILCKLKNKKIIYIESFAKSKSPTLTGKLIYKFADVFYVQWPDMVNVYPKAKYLGGIY